MKTTHCKKPDASLIGLGCHSTILFKGKEDQNNKAWQSPSLPRIHLQIQLHPITDPIILQRQPIPERPFPLPLQHDLMRLPPHPRRHLRLEQPDRIARQTGHRHFGAQPIIHVHDDHGARDGCGTFSGFLFFLLALATPALVVVAGSVSCGGCPGAEFRGHVANSGGGDGAMVACAIPGAEFGS